MFGCEAFGPVWRALMSGRVLRKPWQWLRRALRPQSPVHRAVAASIALLLCAALGIVAIVVKQADGWWASIDTSLVPARTGPGCISG